MSNTLSSRCEFNAITGGSACCTARPGLGAVGLTGTVLGPVLGWDVWDSDDMQVISRVVALSHQLVAEPRPENY